MQTTRLSATTGVIRECRLCRQTGWLAGSLFLLVFLLPPTRAFSQDSSYYFEQKAVTLKEVVVRADLNVPDFIRRVKEDTSFYKAFLNLKVLGYSAINDIRMMGRGNKQKASLNSRTRQAAAGGCRWTRTLEQQHSGDMFDRRGDFNYYTARMYAGIFFAYDTICGESNTAAGASFSTAGKSGMARHKEQLKMLFFNPGKKIPGLPFIGSKIALFDEQVASRYDFIIDMETYRGELCYVFRMLPRADLEAAERSQIVINEMVTWFNTGNWEITGRQYDLSYRAGIYDFDVHIEVEMEKFGEYLVPRTMRYNGNWNMMFKKRERGIFTATLFDFYDPETNGPAGREPDPG